MGTAELLAEIDRTRLPRHVAAIMDGNGRWAAARGLTRIEGHAAGVESVRDTVEGAARLGLGALTVFAFSSENWRRPPGEVAALLELVGRYLRLETDNLSANDIRFRPLGRLGEVKSGFPTSCSSRAPTRSSGRRAPSGRTSGGGTSTRPSSPTSGAAGGPAARSSGGGSRPPNHPLNCRRITL